MKPRPYQQEAFQAVIDGLNRKIHPCVSISTGLGKTLISKMITERVVKKGHKVLFLVNQINLADQASETLGTDNIEGAGRKADWSKKLIIGVVQTICRHPEIVRDEKISLIIVDEFHRSHSTMFLSIFNLVPKVRRIGLSATVLRADKKNLKELFDEVVYNMNIHKGIAEGWLCEYKMIRPKNIGELPLTYISYIRRGEELNRVSYDNPGRNKITVEITRDLIKNKGRKKIIVFCNTVKHAIHLKEMFGSDFGVAHGTDRADLARFRNGELTGVCSVQLLLEGFDYPPTDTIVVAGNISKEGGVVRSTQLIGRSLRLSEGKTHAIILDLSKYGIPDPLLDPELDGDAEKFDKIDSDEEPEADEIIDIYEEETILTGENFINALRTARCAIREEKLAFNATLDIIKVKDNIWQFIGTKYKFSLHGVSFELKKKGERNYFYQFKEMEDFVRDNIHFKVFAELSPDDPVTEGQLKMLKKFKLKKNDIAKLNKKTASETISMMVSKQDSIPASNNQKWKLRDLGVQYEKDLTSSEARSLIGEHVRKK